MGLVLCLVAFVTSFWLGCRSLVTGLGAVLTVGYLYGILRARYLDGFSHFLFDSAVLGFYLSLLGQPSGPAHQRRTASLKLWTLLLIGWPVVLFLVPMQHPLVQLVGLRGNAFLLPFLLIGAGLGPGQLYRLALWLAVLNLIAFGFAAVEYIVGVELFFPRNPVTEIIYLSRDVAGYTAYRIPACFVNAHAYGGTMVMTLPWLVGAWTERHRTAWHGPALVAALAVSLLGAFLAAARIHIVVLFLLLVVITGSGRLKGLLWSGWLLLLGGIGYLVASEERLQRFLTLRDTDYVANRIVGSVNLTFWDLVLNYPLGNGLGGGGTSIPHFLKDLIIRPVAMENEYARILLEQGLPGLCLWAAFLFWVFTRPTGPGHEAWSLGRRLLWFTCAAYFASGLLGTGLLTSVPHTLLLLVGMGWVAAQDPAGYTRSTNRKGFFARKGNHGAAHHGKAV
jgi:hypothetical protein